MRPSHTHTNTHITKEQSDIHLPGSGLLRHTQQWTDATRLLGVLTGLRGTDLIPVVLCGWQALSWAASNIFTFQIRVDDWDKNFCSIVFTHRELHYATLQALQIAILSTVLMTNGCRECSSISSIFFCELKNALAVAFGAFRSIALGRRIPSFPLLSHNIKYNVSLLLFTEHTA